MTVEVVTVFAPRPNHEKFQDYMPLLRLQRDSALHFGHRHCVVTDGHLGAEFNQLRVVLPEDVMPAMIVGVMERLKAGAAHHLLFVDADCLIARSLDEAIDAKLFDVGLTHRANNVAPINNGAMYVHQNGIRRAVIFFREALKHCGTHWGADQEAISIAAAPVEGDDDCVVLRHGCSIGFLSMFQYACVPKRPNFPHKHRPFVVHFKGETKPWMAIYAKNFVLKEAENRAG